MSRRPMIDENGEVRPLEDGEEVPPFRRWQPGDPESVLSPREQEASDLLARARALREEADGLEARAAKLLEPTS